MCKVEKVAHADGIKPVQRFKIVLTFYSKRKRNLRLRMNCLKPFSVCCITTNPSVCYITLLFCQSSFAHEKNLTDNFFSELSAVMLLISE